MMLWKLCCLWMTRYVYNLTGNFISQQFCSIFCFQFKQILAFCQVYDLWPWLICLPIHDIQMKIVCSAIHHSLALICQRSKVRVQNRWPYFGLVVSVCHDGWFVAVLDFNITRSAELISQQLVDSRFMVFYVNVDNKISSVLF